MDVYEWDDAESGRRFRLTRGRGWGVIWLTALTGEREPDYGVERREILRLAGEMEGARAAAATAQERIKELETQVAMDTEAIGRLRGGIETAYGEGFRDAEARICEWLGYFYRTGKFPIEGDAAVAEIHEQIEAGEHRKALPSEE